MRDAHDALDCPENYLWVRHPDGSQTFLTEERLHELQDGEPPEHDFEHILVHDPQWLGTYLKHGIGEHCITITVDKPLPEWDPTWLLTLE